MLKAPSGKPPLHIPAILLEDETPPAPPLPSSTERKFALGPPSLNRPASAEERELPDGYGTGRLLVTARDPHWLYAHWDPSEQDRHRYQAMSRDQRLALRVYLDHVAGEPKAEVQLHPEARHWFLHVEDAGAKYVAQLGCYPTGGDWLPIATSSAVATPPDTVSSDKTMQWGTVPIALLQPRDGEPVEARAAGETASLPAASYPTAERELAGREHRAAIPEGGFKHEDGRKGSFGAVTEWTAAREVALAEETGRALTQRQRTGSVEVAELLRRGIQRERVEQPGPVNLPALTGVLPRSVSSPPGGEMERPRSFWFNINAELIIYGATEPDASVTVDGEPIRLRPDGTFSCRFALPDGLYGLVVAATSADGEARRAELGFTRHTEYQGDVGVHPQDESLQPPPAGDQ